MQASVAEGEEPTPHPVSVPGTTLTAWRWRRGARGADAPPARVLFAHGISDDGRCWTPIVAALLEAHPGAVEAVAYDARGHGRSQPLALASRQAPRGGTSVLERLAEDAIAVVRATGLERPLLVGHSMGAVTVALAAARAPGLARALLLEDPPSPFTPWQQQQPASGADPATPPLPGWLARLRSRELADLVTLCRTDSPGWPADEREPWAAAKRAVAPDLGLLFAALDRDWSPPLADVRCPALVVAGTTERGGLLTAVDAARLVALMPRGELATVPTAGHNVRRDARAAFVASLRRALATE